MSPKSREKAQNFETSGIMQRFILNNRQILIRAAAEKCRLLNQSAFPAKKVSVSQINFFLMLIWNLKDQNGVSITDFKGWEDFFLTDDKNCFA